MKSLVIASTGCVFLASFLLVGKVVAQPPPFISKDAAEREHEFVVSAIPKVEAIESIKAEKTLGAPYGPEVPPFVVPEEFHAEFMEFFENSQIDTDPIFGLEEMGSLLIETKDGKKFRILIYCGANRAPTMFSVKGVRCVKTDWAYGKSEAAGHLSQLIEKTAPKKPEPAQPGRRPGF